MTLSIVSLMIIGTTERMMERIARSSEHQKSLELLSVTGKKEGILFWFWNFKLFWFSVKNGDQVN